MRQSLRQQNRNASSYIFGDHFNLHPLDSLAFLQTTHNHLSQFTEGFKDRIECEIQYSKSLIKVSKILSKHIDPSRPSPISYVSSAFKVENELRARHALQLAQYLHSEIQAPCQQLLLEMEAVLKQMQKDLKRQYKEGEVVEQNYQKHLKKYFRSRQDWQQRMISKTILPYLPGVTFSQIQKANLKLQEEREENLQLQIKYINALQAFNRFAQKYNESINSLLVQIETEATTQLALESNSMRKLIVSQVNMFKNIQYDLLNISRQMETLQPSQQIKLFVDECSKKFTNPIISIYSEGPISQNGLHRIDFKYPINKSLLEQTLLRIQHCHFAWMLQNKHNSTLRHSLQQAWMQFEGRQAQDFMEDLRQCVINNKAVKEIAADNYYRKVEYLNSQQAFSISFSIITTLASFIRPIEITRQKQAQILGLLRSYLLFHHFYRFFAMISIEEFLNLRQNKISSKLQQQRLLMILRLLIEQCITAKDIFILRSIISIMFQTVVGSNQQPLYLKTQLIQNDIWYNNDFWSAILFQGTFEEISLLPTVSKVQLKQIYLMRQKNITFSTLATYCHYMVMIGCEISQVRSMVERFCHIYGLYDEHERDLSKMIKTSASKYQRAIHQFAHGVKLQENKLVQSALTEISTKGALEKQQMEQTEIIKNEIVVQPTINQQKIKQQAPQNFSTEEKQKQLVSENQQTAKQQVVVSPEVQKTQIIQNNQTG